LFHAEYAECAEPSGRKVGIALRFIKICAFCVLLNIFLRFFLDGLGKEAEVHLAVVSLLHEVGMLLKMLILIVFKDKHAALT
jgi:hypothetical protein